MHTNIFLNMGKLSKDVFKFPRKTFLLFSPCLIVSRVLLRKAWLKAFNIPKSVNGFKKLEKNLGLSLNVSFMEII